MMTMVTDEMIKFCLFFFNKKKNKTATTIFVSINMREIKPETRVKKK